MSVQIRRLGLKVKPLSHTGPIGINLCLPATTPTAARRRTDRPPLHSPPDLHGPVPLNGDFVPSGRWHRVRPRVSWLLHTGGRHGGLRRGERRWSAGAGARAVAPAAALARQERPRPAGGPGGRRRASVGRRAGAHRAIGRAPPGFRWAGAARPASGTPAPRPGAGPRRLLGGGASRTRTGPCGSRPGRLGLAAPIGHRDSRHGGAAAAGRTSRRGPRSHARARNDCGDAASYGACAERRPRAGRPAAHAGPGTHR